jgi:hypothetical protein
MQLSNTNNLALIDIRPYTAQMYETLPHVDLTSELKRDHKVLDQIFTDTSEYTNIMNA